MSGFNGAGHRMTMHEAGMNEAGMTEPPGPPHRLLRRTRG